MEHVLLEPAFVVHQHAYRETSILVDVLTRDHGRIGVVARGAKRPKSPLRAMLQPFSPLLVSWSARGELGTLRSAERSEILAPLGGRALLAGLYLNELVVRLTHRFDPHPGVFEAYADTVRMLARDGVSEPRLRRFEKLLLDELGYGLQLEHDAESGIPVATGERYRYHPMRGPVLDQGADQRRDAEGVVVSGSTLIALANGGALSDEMLREAKRIMRAEIDSHLGHRPLAARELFRGRARGAC